MDIIIKAFESSKNNHEIHIFSGKGDFIGNSHMRLIEEKYFEVDGPVARKGFGKYLYNFMAMYAKENNKKIISAMDGDTRSGALKNWERIYKDKNFEKEKIPKHLRSELLEFTNEEEAPFLFYASSIEPDELYKKSKLDNEDVGHFFKFRELKEKYSEIFGTTYQLDCNEWIDEEYPMKKNELLNKLENKKNKKNKYK